MSRLVDEPGVMGEPLRRQDVDDRLYERICGEYVDMPGLCLTVEQASRLWSAPTAVSQAVLDALVDSAFLRRQGPYYVRADSERPCCA